MGGGGLFSGFMTRSATNPAVKPKKMAKDLEFRNRKKTDCAIYVAKSDCAADLAYAKSSFSHDVAHMYQANAIIAELKN